MDITFPIPDNKYRTLSFDLVHHILANYFFLNSDFSVCYRFMSFPDEQAGNKQGRLEIITITDPGAVSFEEHYLAEYDMKEEKLFIHFLNDRFEVKSLKAYFGENKAMKLHLVASGGNSHYFYSAATDPFNPYHKTVYGIS